MKRRPWGFALVWFYGFLLPTSAKPLVNVADEYRAYLPMAAASALFAGGGWVFLGWAFRSREGLRAWIGAVLAALAVLALGATAWERNQDYETPLSLWSDVLAKRPDNDLARYKVLAWMAAGGRTREAALLYDERPLVGPFPGAVHLSLGRLLAVLGKKEEALVHLRRAVAREPEDPAAWAALGAALLDSGSLAGAVESLERATALDTADGEIWNNLGVALGQAGKPDQALEAFARALATRPDLLQALLNQGALLSRMGRHDRAVETLRLAVAVHPDSAAAKQELARALERIGKKEGFSEE